MAINPYPFSYQIILNASTTTTGKLFFTTGGKAHSFCGRGFITIGTIATFQYYVGAEDLRNIAPDALTESDFQPIIQANTTIQLTNENNFICINGAGLFRILISNTAADTISISKCIGNS